MFHFTSPLSMVQLRGLTDFGEVRLPFCWSSCHQRLLVLFFLLSCIFVTIVYNWRCWHVQVLIPCWVTRRLRWCRQPCCSWDFLVIKAYFCLSLVLNGRLPPILTVPDLIPRWYSSLYCPWSSLAVSPLLVVLVDRLLLIVFLLLSCCWSSCLLLVLSVFNLHHHRRVLVVVLLLQAAALA